MFENKKANSVSHFSSSLDNKRNSLFIQRRLKLGNPGDKYEVEADNVANKIVADGKIQSVGTSFFSPSMVQTIPGNIQKEQTEEEILQREAMEGSESDFVQNMDLPEEENLQTKCVDCVDQEQQIQANSENQSESDPIAGNNLNYNIGNGSNNDTGIRPETESGFAAGFGNLTISNNYNNVETSTDLDVQASGLTGSVTLMDCSDGRNINNNGDHDLDKLVHQPDDRSPDIIAYDYVFGESGAYSDFFIGFFAGTFGVDTSDDNRLFSNFTAGSGSQINFSTGSDMAREIGGTDAFTTFANEFEESVRNYYNTNDTLQGFDCQAELIRTRPNYMGGTDSLFSWAVMGGYQRLEAHIDLSAGQIDITYRVFDHYGAGVSDAWSYLPGLSAMYYLQHYVTGSSNTYVPFIWSVRINRLSTL